jgi:hypothetical protein
MLVTLKSCPAPGRAFRLGDVSDRRGYNDAANVGFTQTGLGNSKTSLRTSPPPAGLIQRTLDLVLQTCGTPPGSEPIVLDVIMSRFQTTETTGFTSEEIEAEIALQVRARMASGPLLGGFDVSASAKESGMDTTDEAEGVIDRALQQSAQRFAAGLAELSKRLPPPSALHAAAASAPLAPATSTTDNRVSVEATRLSPAREDELFDDDLKDAGLIPISVKVAVRGAVARLSMRRDGFLVAFDDRASKTALDPRKVQEEVRTNVMTYALMFGLIGAAIASDSNASSQGAVGDTSLEKAYLDTAHPSLEGILFFSHTASSRPTVLSVEIVDTATGRIETVRVPVSMGR